MNLICTRGAAYEYTDQDTGKKYFSVSQVLDVLDPHAFDAVNAEVLAAAQDRGTALHVLFGLLLIARAGLCEQPERPSGDLGGYFDAMERFIAEKQPETIRVEEPSLNDRLRFAGTPDCLVTIAKRVMLIDLKTGGKRVVHKTQLIAYRSMEGYGEAKQMGTLYVHKDGTYQLDMLDKPDEAFHLAWMQAGLSVLHGRRMHNL